MLKTSAILVSCILTALVTLTGCTSTLPVVDQKSLEIDMREISASKGTLYSWHGRRDKLMTYWGPQHISLDVKASIPEDWQEPGDGTWAVDAHNAENKPLPFIGVIHTYVNENGDTRAVFVPPLDLAKASDGLYVIIRPGIHLNAGKIAHISPTALIYEIRDHTFRPFRVKIPLVPAEQSELTPAPKPLPEIPIGTPISID